MNANTDEIPNATIIDSADDNTESPSPYLYRVHDNEGNKPE